MPPTRQNLLDKVWDAHTVRELPGGQTQLFIGLHLIHEVTSPQAFAMLREMGLPVRFPKRTFATVDHIIPTDSRERPLADALAETEPENAARLREALQAAQKGLVASRMEKLVTALRASKHGEAKQDAEQIVKGLDRLLDILTETDSDLEDALQEQGSDRATLLAAHVGVTEVDRRDVAAVHDGLKIEGVSTTAEDSARDETVHEDLVDP